MRVLDISPHPFIPRYLGLVPYQEALSLQHELLQQRAANTIPDVLLLLQHPAVFTTGRFRGEGELLASREQLEREGIEVVPTNRGGSITFHGVGQLVGYPILDLKELGIGVREYVWNLEEVVIRVLAGRGIEGWRRAGYPGVWAGEDKICSLGIHVTGHITMHGFALNVDTDLRYFDYINPCGLQGVSMTSMSKVLGYPLKCEDIIPEVIEAFSGVFGLRQTGPAISGGTGVPACGCRTLVIPAKAGIHRGGERWLDKARAGTEACGTPAEPQAGTPVPPGPFAAAQGDKGVFGVLSPLSRGISLSHRRRCQWVPRAGGSRTAPTESGAPHTCHSERRRGIFLGWWPSPTGRDACAAETRRPQAGTPVPLRPVVHRQGRLCH